VKNLFYLNKYFVKYKWHLLLGIVFVTLSNYFKVLIPQEIRNALDFVYARLQEKESGVAVEIPTDELLRFALTVVGFSIMMGIFMYLMRQTIIVMSRLIEYDMRKEIFTNYESQDINFFKRWKTGDLMSRVSEDVSKVRMYLGPAILYGINLSTMTIIVLYSMFKVSPKLTLYTLLPLPFLSISIYIVSRMINKRSELIQKQIARLTSISQEVFSGIRIVKSYAKEKQFADFFESETQLYKDKSMDLARVNALFFPLMIMLISLSSLLTIYIGGILVNKGEISNGHIAEFIIYVNYLTWPFTAVGWIASIVQQAEASQKRINEILQITPAITNENQEEYPVKGKIEFKNVSFSYPDTGIQAMKNASFVLEPGEKLMVLGKTASGKTTLADLILRMYDVDSGQILIDDVDVREHNLDVLRQKIGYVPQDVFLFSDNIENNIIFGNDNNDVSRVEEFAEYASVHQDILDLPDGYKTTVGERGVTLSGGQKQRVSIARAFIKEPKIIIMDDSLSAVDTKTENTILNYLNTILKDKTAILITHRLFKNLNIDKIIVLDEGRIVEMGTPKELYRNKSFYYDLVEQQSLEEIS